MGWLCIVPFLHVPSEHRNMNDFPSTHDSGSTSSACEAGGCYRRSVRRYEVKPISKQTLIRDRLGH